jgi:ubiquinone/menaquinone biosynthesis C-methylase UbiE
MFFYVTVCYGGALSYVFDKIDTTLSEFIRVTKKGGFILFCVMSLIGTVKYFNEELFDDAAIKYGLFETDRVVFTGNLTGDISR